MTLSMLHFSSSYITIWMKSCTIIFEDIYIYIYVLCFFSLLSVEVKKKSSCYVCLVNKSEEYVAFKVGIQS